MDFHHFSFIGVKTVQFSEEGEHTVILSESDQFEVKQGDLMVLEWKDQQPIPFEALECDGELRTSRRVRRHKTPEFYGPGDEIVATPVIKSHRQVCAAYMVQAIIKVIE